MSITFQTKSPNPQFNDVTDVAPQEVLENASQLTLIDVRETSEYVGELGHVKGTQLVVLSTLPQQINTLPQNKPIIFICRSGGRSAQATAFAKSNGFKDVYNMKGGMLLWNQLLLPTEK